MKTKRFIIFRNVFFILMALVLVGGLTAGWRAATSDSSDEPAECYVANLDISPPEVGVGEQATITVVIANPGDSEGTYTTILKINDKEDERSKTEVPVPAGETRAVVFTLKFDTPGTYDIEMGGWKGTLEVTPVEE